MFKMEQIPTSVDIWKEIESDPSESYKEYFEEEKEYLKSNLNLKYIFLDVGCGDGRTIKYVSQFCKKVCGVDYDEKAFNNCKENIKDIGNVEVFLEDGSNMHFDDNSFDVVFVGLTFSNFGDSKFAVLKEIKRVLKENGKFILSAYNENSFYERWKYYKKYLSDAVEIVDKEKGLVKSKSGKEVSEQFTEHELRNIINESGFEIIEIKKGKIFYLIKVEKK